MWYSSIFWKKSRSGENESALRFFFIKSLQNERGWNVHKNFISYFRRTKFIWGNSIFLAFRLFFTVWLGMVKLSQVAVNWILKSQGMISVMITTGSLNNQNMTRILKQWRHDFSGRHLHDRYCMDIIWYLCVDQNSWFCKACLRICYVSLFECKGHWMLKTVINCHVFNRTLLN